MDSMSWLVTGELLIASGAVIIILYQKACFLQMEGLAC